MKKQILTIAALVVGFMAGATALSAIAQTGGTWTAPTAPPPGGNVAAPINEGATAQQKNGWLGLTGLITANLQIASGTPGVGNILVSDAAGNAKWQPVSNPAGSCTLIANSSANTDWQPIDIPSPCIDGFCRIAFVVYNANTNLVDDVKMADYTQLSNPAKKSTISWGNGVGGIQFLATNRWVTTSDRNGGCDSAGLNGPNGTSKCIVDSGHGTLKLLDNSSGVETSAAQWSLGPGGANYWGEVYVCK